MLSLITVDGASLCAGIVLGAGALLLLLFLFEPNDDEG